MLIDFSSVHFRALLGGFRWTVQLSLISFVLGGLVGFLVALCRTSTQRGVVFAASWYIRLIQGSPMLVIMFVTFFGLPIIGLDASPLTAATIGMTLFASAFLGEIWRGCIQSVPRTQWEAADCLGLSYALRMSLVILPQALRIATPPTVGFMVQIVKNTSLVSVIGMAEMTYIGKLINASTYQPVTTYLIIAALYFSLCFPLSWCSRSLERKLNVGRR